MVGKVLQAVICYYGKELRQTAHSLKVYGYAKAIAAGEGLDAVQTELVECAALLHDIGIPESMRKYGSAKGPYQEEQGALVGGEILNGLECPGELREQILFLIGHHHSYGVQGGGVPLQILFEADFLVNLEEGNLGGTDPKNIKEKYFQTATGNKLIDVMYLGE